MGTRSVRLDEEAEGALTEIVNSTGLSISDAIKQGLISYRLTAIESSKKKTSAFFNDCDLGEGGYAIGSARQSKTLLKEKMRAKRAKK